jgi:hypothetical protein
MHAMNESNAQGSAFAIAYESDLSKIKMEDLVVFSVLKQSVIHIFSCGFPLTLMQYSMAPPRHISCPSWNAQVSTRRLYLCLAVGAERMWSTKYVHARLQVHGYWGDGYASFLHPSPITRTNIHIHHTRQQEDRQSEATGLVQR